MNNLEGILNLLSEQDKRVKELNNRISELSTKANCTESILNLDSVEIAANISALQVKNTKFSHRCSILKRAVASLNEKSANGDDLHMGLQELITRLFADAVSLAFPQIEIKSIPVTTSSKNCFGDYQCNVSMSISTLLKKEGIKCPPLKVANEIKNNVLNNELIERIEIANPGYLNVFLRTSYLKHSLIKLMKDGLKPPPLLKKQKIVVDFSAPNIAKEMHVGHLRSTIIGDSICRLLEFMGHDVLRVNHVGDWGTQFGMLIAHLQEKFPNYLTESPPISSLQSFYKESKVRFDNDTEFRSKAYSCVVKLQSFYPDYLKAWNLICDVSRREFQLIYDKLNVVLEEKGESFYQSRMEKLVKQLHEKGLLEEDEGRKVMFGLSRTEIPFTIVKSDGGFTYDTSDLACMKYRIEEENADRIIYVTDSGQAMHFKVLISCAQRAGILNPNLVRIDHVGFGVVLGEDGKKFKTRSGDTVRLNDLLEEGVKRAGEKLIEKGRLSVLSPDELQAAKEAVAYGCIKYADLSRCRINDYIFSFDKMLEDKGNTAVYLLYALTRIRSIARSAGVGLDEIKAFADKENFNFSHEKEWKLLKVLLRFTDILLSIVDDLFLHRLCEYLYDVAATFTEFYDVCYCIEKDTKTGIINRIHYERLVLCECTAIVMEKCFDILGLKPVQRM